MQTKTDSAPLVDIRGAVFLKWMVDGPKVLVPEVKEGTVTYPDVTRLIHAVDSVEFLDRLAGTGILKKERYLSEILCPSCGSSTLRDKYTCTFCRGDRLESGEMIEHYACGNVDFEVKFQKDGRLVCPKCGKELKVIGTDYRRVGRVFRCDDCGRDSSIPRITHVCQNCGTVSTWEQVRLRILHQYRINEEKKKEIDSLTGIYLPLLEFMQKEGLKVESPAFLEGESGVEHSFDILARNDGRRTVFDIVTGRDSVDETAVITFFAKALDVAHDESVLISVPKASERAKRLCKLYNIALVEGDSIDEILASMATLSLKGQVTSRALVHATPASLDAETAKMRGLRAKIALLEETATKPMEEASPSSELRTLQAKISALQKVTERGIEEGVTFSNVAQGPKSQLPQGNVSRPPSSNIERHLAAEEDKRLYELERLYLHGKLGEEEYEANRKRILGMVRGAAPSRTDG